MLMKTLIGATGLAIAATAAKIPTRSADTSAGFRLWTNTTYPGKPIEFGPEVQGMELSYIPMADCLAEVVLVPAGQGAVFRADGDTVGVAHIGDEDSPSAGMVITVGGTATVPIGKPVELKCADGTPGVFLTDDGLDYPEESGSNGGFMACRDNKRGILVLSFFQAGQRILMGCTVVQPLPIF